MESQRSLILFTLVLVAVLQQHGHHVQTAPTTARQTGALDDVVHEMKEEQFSGTNNLDLLGSSRINWGLAETAATATNDAVHMKPEQKEEEERRLVSDIETLSTAATVHQSGLDDSSIEANDRNKTATDEEATSAASPSTRTATGNATPTGSSESFAPPSPVVSSSPTSIVPRKKIRRSTTTTSTTALPPINTESEEVNQRTVEDVLVTTTDSDLELTPSASPRPKTRKMRKKVSKKIDWETSTQQQQSTTWRTTARVIEEEASTVTSATVEGLESNGMTTAKLGIQSTADTPVPPEEQRGTIVESIDEHDRGNAVRVTPSTTTTSTTTERKDVEVHWEMTTPGVSPEEVSMDYETIQTTTMGTSTDGESSSVTGASSTSATELPRPLASETVETTEINLPTEESPGFSLNQDRKPEGGEQNQKEEEEDELKVASKDSSEADDHQTELSETKELFPKYSSSSSSPPAPPANEDKGKPQTEAPPTSIHQRPSESEVEQEVVQHQLSSIAPSSSSTTSTPSTPEQHHLDLTSATEFVESSPIVTHPDLVFVTHTPSEVLSSSSSEKDPANDLRLTSTTVFEDNSAITTTTEFISSQSAATTLGHVIHSSGDSENSDASETHKKNEWEEEEGRDKNADNPNTPTTEPRVEGINVENVEESLSPIPDDDVLVVEIEESNETVQVSQEETPTTTTTTLAVTGGSYSSSSSPSASASASPTTRPKLNDELFYPIGGRDGGTGGGDETETETELVRERGRVDLEDDNNESANREDETKDIDGRSNDNDGDFDLEAEIFPTIPAPKNALFDSEILREKDDLKESDKDAEHVTSRGNGIVPVQPETTTNAPSATTTTQEQESPPKKKTSVGGQSTSTSSEDDQEVSTVSHHDSDTFFYISNTEVKVVESEQGNAVSHKQELSFPENPHEEGLPRTLPHQNHSHRSVAAVELNERRRQQEEEERLSSSPVLVEEDIILSQANENSFNNRDPGDFDFLKFAAAERPQRVAEEDEKERERDKVQQKETRSGEEVDIEEVTKRMSQGNTEQLSFVKVEETTEVYSSEEAFEFLHHPEEEKFIISSSSRERSKEDSIPEVIIEPYPQLMDTDNDLPISVGVPVIAELPQQIQIGAAAQNEEGQEQGQGQDEAKSEQLPSYHHFDIDNREIEDANNNRKSLKTTAVRKLKKSGPGKKKPSNRKKPDRDESFSEIIFENAENFLVKNPSISLEVPVLDFNFTVFHASTSTTIGPKLNFTNETTLMLEEEPIGINDLQTLFFTCIITLMLLVAAVFVAFVARFLWNKHYTYGTGLLGDSSTDPLDVKTRTLSTDVDEFKSRDSGISMFKTQDLETAADQYGNGIVPANSIGHKNGDALIELNGTTTPYATGANGSIITMTLKNNHLIVETEERSDISRDARETKMHYSPSEKDGVFVVEVARGADTSYHSPRSSIIVQQQQAQQFNGVDLLNTSSTAMNNSNGCSQEQQRVQVHHHPAPQAQQAEVANGTTKCSTGLSQSDLSDSSGCSSNKDYNYGGLSGQGGLYIASSSVESTGQKSASSNALTGEGEEEQQQQQFKGQTQKQQHRPVTKQETIDLQPRLQSDIDLVNNVETERREHCNGHSADKIIPDILVKSSGGAELTSLIESVES